MKHLFIFFIVPLMLLNITSQKADFVGKWIGEDKGDIGYIVFDEEGYASFEIEGQIMGGKEFTMNGQKGKMTYSINDKVNPIEIDFIITKIDTEESMELLGIAEFIDKDTVNFSISYNSVRPTQFGETSIILKRVK